MDLEKAIQSQLTNIQAKVGKTLDEIFALIAQSGLEKHCQVRDFAKSEFGIGHGDANAIANQYMKAKAPVDATEDPLDEIYAGPKAALRPIHDALMAKIKDHSAIIGVIGLGYVGLPFAVVNAKIGFRVVGIEQNPKRAGRVNAGDNYIEDVVDSDLRDLVASLLAATLSAGIAKLERLHVAAFPKETRTTK